jgi:hypothetical protein
VKHRSKLPHLGKVGMILQVKSVFTPDAPMEDLEKGINLPLIQSGVKSDLSKFKFCAGSERGPGLGGVPRCWMPTLRMVFAIVFKSDNLWG